MRKKKENFNSRTLRKNNFPSNYNNYKNNLSYKKKNQVKT